MAVAITWTTTSETADEMIAAKLTNGSSPVLENESISITVETTISVPPDGNYALVLGLFGVALLAILFLASSKNIFGRLVWIQAMGANVFRHDPDLATALDSPKEADSDKDDLDAKKDLEALPDSQLYPASPTSFRKYALIMASLMPLGESSRPQPTVTVTSYDSESGGSKAASAKPASAASAPVPPPVPMVVKEKPRRAEEKF